VYLRGIEAIEPNGKILIIFPTRCQKTKTDFFSIF